MESPLIRASVVYPCTTTRGIVLDLVPDISTITFIHSFIDLYRQEIAPKLCFQWKLTKAEAHWFGWLWERIISQVKRYLKRNLEKKNLFEFSWIANCVIRSWSNFEFLTFGCSVRWQLCKYWPQVIYCFDESWDYWMIFQKKSMIRGL